MAGAAAAFDDAADDARHHGRRGRRLRRQLRLQRDQELNVVSLIDVFAVLMFFLLVTSSISAARLNVLALELPARAAPADPAPVRRPCIRLLEAALLVDIGDGRVQRLQVRDAPRLAALLLRARQRAPQQDGIDLLVAPDVAYDQVVAVIDAMRAVTPQAIAAGYPGELFPALAIGEAVAEGTRR